MFGQDRSGRTRCGSGSWVAILAFHSLSTKWVCWRESFVRLTTWAALMWPSCQPLSTSPKPEWVATTSPETLTVTINQPKWNKIVCFRWKFGFKIVALEKEETSLCQVRVLNLSKRAKILPKIDHHLSSTPWHHSWRHSSRKSLPWAWSRPIKCTASCTHVGVTCKRCMGSIRTIDLSLRMHNFRFSIGIPRLPVLFSTCDNHLLLLQFKLVTFTPEAHWSYSPGRCSNLVNQ